MKKVYIILVFSPVSPVFMDDGKPLADQGKLNLYHMSLFAKPSMSYISEVCCKT